ncbi:MAG: ATP-dependent helicase [Butyrivibrio sp.]|nr:ATP-dependent helicase [Butyrivibrio sp.]
MANNNIKFKYVPELLMQPINAEKYMTDYFGDEELAKLYIDIQREMVKCDPELKFRKEDMTIGLSHSKDDKFILSVFKIPNKGYQIQFNDYDCQKFDVENKTIYLKECEKAVKAAELQKIEKLDIPTGITGSLNNEQNSFCSTNKISITKNVRLLAPAGTGKTYSILWRCKKITDSCIKNGKDLPFFLIVTFTKSASIEIEKRLMEPEFAAIRASVRTLNSWGWEQVKTYHPDVVDVKIVDDVHDRRNLVMTHLVNIDKKVVKKLFEEKAKHRYKTAEGIIDLIDIMKGLGFNHNMTIPQYRRYKKDLNKIGLLKKYEDAIALYSEYLQDNGISVDRVIDEQFFDFWKKAVKYLEENKLFTMEDQKYWAKHYLDEKLELKQFAKGMGKYSHVIVDEFQDVNPLDISLLKSIITYYGNGKKPVSLTIVGDDDQAIFGWRGSSPEYILNPEKYFENDFSTVTLTKNYRCPKAIVNHANTLISKNISRVNKKMESVAKGRATIKVIKPKRGETSFDATVKLIHELIEEKNCKHIALIGRKQVSLFPYQVLLYRDGINYNIDADLDIFEGQAMSDFLEITRIIYRANSFDNDDPVGDLIKVCSRFAKYGSKLTAYSNLEKYLNEKHPYNFKDALQMLKEYDGKIHKYDMKSYYLAIEHALEAKTIFDYIEVLKNEFHGFERDYAKAEVDNHYKDPQLDRLAELSLDYGNDFRLFCQALVNARTTARICRDFNREGYGNGYKKDEEVPVHLLTATRSKGKEFDAVVILEPYEGEWPAKLAMDIEEERRLFYVAMTRSKQYLYFITDEKAPLSRFLRESDIIR